ncbi:hypothetical protein BH09BAC1_BH09BAC1_14460 [soil metagenome]
MRNFKFLLILLSFIVGLADPMMAQTHGCGTDAKHRELIAKYPEVRLALPQYNQSNKNGSRDAEDVYVIPVVFHIIHNYGAENISDAQIYDAVSILNLDFRKQNADTAAIVPAFKNIAADAFIEFRLASKDPHGNCTNGIDRIQSTQTYNGDDVAKLNPWPRNYYLNIWVVASMRDGVAGYAYYPSAVEGLLAKIDGVIILSQYVGSIGTGSIGNSRALTHEIGHSFSLPHTWGNTNDPGVACGEDGIRDTPLTKGHTSCNLNDASCTPGVIENVQNYMEYAYCSKMFTQDQVAAMRFALESNTSGRNLLWQQGNLVFTGTQNSTPVACSPIADFYATQHMVCEGDAVTFKDASWRGEITDYTWSFEGGMPATSNDVNPMVTFDTPGWHNVTLTVTATNGSNTITKNNMVYVFPSTADYTGSYSEDFSDESRFVTDFLPLNLDVISDSKWERNADAGYSGWNSVSLNSYGNIKNDLDELIGPAIDLSGLTAPQYLYFHYSNATNAQNFAQIKDSLKIFYSIDCGKNWVRMSTLTGLALANDAFHAESFVPYQQRNWKGHAIALPQAALTSNFRFKFQFKSSEYSNNIYIDDINIASVVAVDELGALSQSLIAYPNPTQNLLTLEYKTSNTTNVKVGMYDLMGKEVVALYAGIQSAGGQLLQLNTSTLANGVYFVKLHVGNQTITKMVVIAK